VMSACVSVCFVLGWCGARVRGCQGVDFYFVGCQFVVCLVVLPGSFACVCPRYWIGWNVFWTALSP
jgi:hypothetical protein